jgi:hypothetical protein
MYKIYSGNEAETGFMLDALKLAMGGTEIKLFDGGSDTRRADRAAYRRDVESMGGQITLETGGMMKAVLPFNLLLVVCLIEKINSERHISAIKKNR